MIASVKEWVDVLCRLQISPNQFLICWLVYQKDTASAIQYFEENVNNRFSHTDINDLVERDFLLRLTTDTQNYQLDYFVTTPKFSEGLLIDEDDAGDEFWDAYPSWMVINNIKVSAKSTDVDDIKEKYVKKIKGSLKKHREIIEIVKKYAEENKGLARMGIEKFVGSEQWKLLKEKWDDEGEQKDFY